MHARPFHSMRTEADTPRSKSGPNSRICWRAGFARTHLWHYSRKLRRCSIPGCVHVHTCCVAADAQCTCLVAFAHEDSAKSDSNLNMGVEKKVRRAGSCDVAASLLVRVESRIRYVAHAGVEDIAQGAPKTNNLKSKYISWICRTMYCRRESIMKF